MGKRKFGICCLCGKHGVVTRDHVFPKNLFPPPRPNLITSPACAKCNNDLTKDEEYFRACILVGKAYEHPTGRALWETKVRDSFNSRPGFRALLASQSRLATLEAPNGMQLRNVPLLELDRPRIERVVRKMVQGLYYYHEGSVLSPTTPFFISAETLDVNAGLAITAEAWKLVPVHSVAQGAIKYRFGVSREDPTKSMWWLLFYDGVLFTVITGVEENPESS